MLLCLVALALVSCTDPKSEGQGNKAPAKAEQQGSVSGSIMTPVTAPIRAREHLRQQVRIINHQSQLRNQKLQSIQGQPGR